MKIKFIQSSYFAGILVLFIASCAIQINAIAQGVTADHIARMKSVNGSVISEDGKFVAYTLSNPADAFKENSPNSNHLYVLNTATGETKPYYTSSSAGNVVFRPVKGTVTFLSKASGDASNAIYEINLNGGEATKIFTTTGTILNFTWNADGNHLAYTVKESAKAPATSLTYKPNFYEEEFSSQKGFMVNVGVEKSEPRPLNVNGTIYMMSWSPDGTKLAVSVAPTSSVDDSYMKQQVVILDVATGNVSATIDNKGKLGQIVWSPDNKQIAIRAAKDIHDPTDGRILIVSATGGTPSIIDAGFLGKYESISWPELNAIYFLASEGTATSIGSVKPDGSGKQFIFRAPEHAITSISRAKNGAISFVASAPTHPSELFTISAVKNSQPVKRTSSNAWLNEVKLGKQEVIRYKARDGKFEIEGIVIYPLNYVAGTPVPLITVAHGGPESHYSNGWLTNYSVPGQMAAATGYAVFYPNYRGSTGRGIEFIYSSQADLAGKEFDDIVDGVDYLIAQKVADKSRVGITGGSYGGYASAWMSTFYSDRFAASVMFVGISNNISLWGTSDIPEEMFLVHSRKRLWDDWQMALDRSPIKYVDRAQTPILIMHGADDPRVHPGQSQELYRHIKVRKPDLPVRLIYYPGEGHGNTRSGSKYDYNFRMMQWFDTYLKTGNPKAEKPVLDLPVKK